MVSWVYVFSKFTSEALLFEGLGICILTAVYAVFFVLRVRRLGVIKTHVPSNLVKVYLNELIVDAERMRAQLFGLLGGVPSAAGHGAPAGHATGSALFSGMGVPLTSIQPLAPIPMGADGLDAAVAAKLQQMEAKLAEQTQAIEGLSSEKRRIELELLQAKSTGGGGSAATDGASNEMAEKIQILEARLAEYSIIEDDLANLKRLQQENTQLRATLAGKTDAPAAGAAQTSPEPTPEPTLAAKPASSAPSKTAASPAATPKEAIAEDGSTEEVSAESASAASGDIAVEDELAAALAAAPAPEPMADLSNDAAEALIAQAFDNLSPSVSSAQLTPAASTLAAAVVPASAEIDFEGLVDQVEQSLATEPPKTAAAPLSPAEAAAAPKAAASPAASGDAIEKSDADLVAEFEKMLNG